MFFMAKSAVCIGIVAVLAAGAGGIRDLGSTLERDGRDTALRLGQACAVSEDCVGVGARIASAAIARTGIGQAAIVRASLAGATAAPPTEPSAASDPGVEPPHAGRRIFRHASRRVIARD